MDYIKEAKDFLEEAKEELEKGIREEDKILMRDACEKAWGAVVQLMNALFLRMGVSPLPKSHRERRIRLSQLETEDKRLKRKNIVDRFMARDYILHERAFYDGDLVVPEIREEFKKIERLIRDVERI